MNDMSSVIIPKSDQWNADDFIAGPQTFTIREVHIRGGQEQPVNIALEGTDKFFRPCKSMSRVLVQAWGPDASKYVGRSLTLYRDPTVKWAGMEVGGIRISHMSHIDGEKLMMLTATKGSRKPHKVMPLVDAPNSAGADKEREWADKFIANVDRAPDAAKLDAFVGGKAKLLEELKEARPDLHAECETAIGARRASFAPVEQADEDPFAESDDDDPFGLPPSAGTTEQRPDDADHGEAIEETPASAFLTKIRGQIEAAKNTGYLKATEDEWVKHRAPYDDETAAEIDNLLGAKRRALIEGDGGR